MLIAARSVPVGASDLTTSAGSVRVVTFDLPGWLLLVQFLSPAARSARPFATAWRAAATSARPSCRKHPACAATHAARPRYNSEPDSEGPPCAARHPADHRWLVIIAVLACGRASRAGRRPGRRANRSPAYARVIDGDSLEIAGVRFRLFGIDAPERDQDVPRRRRQDLCVRARRIPRARGRDRRPQRHLHAGRSRSVQPRRCGLHGRRCRSRRSHGARRPCA